MEAAPAPAREDIQARLRRAPQVILPDTWANRSQRTRAPRQLYQAGETNRDRRGERGGQSTSARRDN